MDSDSDTVTIRNLPLTIRGSLSNLPEWLKPDEDDIPHFEQDYDSSIYDPDISLLQAIHLYNESSEANIAVAARESALQRLQESVDAERAKLLELQERSNVLFNSIHKLGNEKHRPIRFMRRKTDPDIASMEADAEARTKEEYRRVFEMERTQRVVTERAAESLASLREEVAKLRFIASTIDDRFKQVREAAQGCESVSYAMETAIEQTEDELKGYERAYEEATHNLAIVNRAKVLLQHAHHFFTRVISLHESVRGIGSVGIEIDRMNILKRAIQESIKVQALLNEGLKVVRQIDAFIVPREILEDMDCIASRGALQTTKAYNLLYGGSTNAAYVKTQMDSLVRRQDQCFKALTNVVVWVQNREPYYETEIAETRDRRKACRRNLIDLWHEADRRGSE